MFLLLVLGLGAGSFHAAAQEARAYHFILRNGDRLTGTIVAETTNAVVITNAVLGRVLLPAHELVRREPVPPGAITPALPASASVTNRAPVLTPEQKKRLDELLQVFMANQISPVEYQRRRGALLSPPPLVPPPKQWTGEILAGVDLGFGAKSRQHFSSRAKINFVEKRLRNALDYLFTYGHADGELSANRMDATDKIDFDVGPRYYLYALGAAGYDEVRKIDYYLQGGPGFGEHLIKTTNLLLNAEVGASYQLQNFEGGSDTQLIYYRLAEDLKWLITPKLTFEEKLEYMPQFDDFGEFKVRGEVNLRFWVLNNLSLNLTVIDLFDTRVAEGISRNDLQILSSIGVKF